MPVLSSPPGPPARPLVGHLPELRRDRLGFYTACARRYGDIVALRFGPRPAVLLSHPDHVQTVLVTQHRAVIKHFAWRLNRPIFGEGLLTSEGETWRRQRRLVQPAFHRHRITAYGAEMVAATERLLAGWGDGETRDIHAEMMRLTLTIVTRTLFGAEVAGEEDAIGQDVAVLLAGFIARVGSPLPLPLWLPTPANRRIRAALRRIDALVYRFIGARRRAGGAGDDLLSLLLAARDEGDGQGMSERHLRDEVLTLFLAGHETTAVALSWTWHLLAQHPGVEERLLAELHDVLGGRPPTVDDLPRLPYCEVVITEAMGLYPPAWIVGREALRDLTIGGYRLPAGTTLLMSQWVIHRDERFYEAPADFRPERWLAGLAERLPAGAYFPFGGGPRRCLGSGFAMTEAVLLLATIAPRFRLASVPDRSVVPQPLVTLRPRDGLLMTLHQR